MQGRARTNDRPRLQGPLPSRLKGGSWIMQASQGRGFGEMVAPRAEGKKVRGRIVLCMCMH